MNMTMKKTNVCPIPEASPTHGSSAADPPASIRLTPSTGPLETEPDAEPDAMTSMTSMTSVGWRRDCLKLVLGTSAARHTVPRGLGYGPALSHAHARR